MCEHCLRSKHTAVGVEYVEVEPTCCYVYSTWRCTSSCNGHKCPMRHQLFAILIGFEVVEGLRITLFIGIIKIAALIWGRNYRAEICNFHCLNTKGARITALRWLTIPVKCTSHPMANDYFRRNIIIPLSNQIHISANGNDSSGSIFRTLYRLQRNENHIRKPVRAINHIWR